MKVHIHSSAKARDYFNQGKQFLDAAWNCYGKKCDSSVNIVADGKFQQLPAPCVVNAAFSCEIFLKSLLIKLGIEYDARQKGHDLCSLYKKLPYNIQDAIAIFCGGKNNVIAFVNWINAHAKDFVDIRYFIEHNGWTETSPTMMITMADNLSRIVDYLLDSSNLEEIMQ